MRRLVLVALVVGIVGIVSHILTVWTTPRVVMRTAWSQFTEQFGVNTVGRPALPTAGTRDVALPSPDMLHAVCAFDVSKGPVRLTAKVPPGYWSMAVYAMNTDAVFSVNDRVTGEGTVAFILVKAPRRTGAKPGAAAARPADKGVRTIFVPDSQGIVVVRTLVRNRANMGDQKAAQASVICTQVGAAPAAKVTK